MQEFCYMRHHCFMSHLSRLQDNTRINMLKLPQAPNYAIDTKWNTYLDRACVTQIR